ncbi:PepSY domain-containing protein [Pseudomonas sp. AS2.8]|uniref:PepSY domain-containing protein n=1 Tax=Pseudomonas sp. AS2.8 TaxID=2587128 RepID=UPI001846F41D|nr:PepSY domain-containing protein [Pseudomonas sp. AS2.8]MBB2895847.1 putative membrane protein YkoI [Pseudomonas sp. AS2.8]
MGSGTRRHHWRSPERPARQLTLGLAGLVLLGSLSPLVQARDLDQDEALKLRTEGVIRPLESLLQRVNERYPQARLLEAELEEEDGQYRYEIEILVGDVVRELEIGAMDGAIMKDEVDD